MASLKKNFEQVYNRIKQAEHSCGRVGKVKLLAVSKKKPASIIEDAYHLGQRHFGESYIQEALLKIEKLSGFNKIIWHFIGAVQSNKTRDIASNFHWIHSVDRLKIAKRLSDQRSNILPPINICLQVNINGEASKSGITINELPELVDATSKLPQLKLRGLMAIPVLETTHSKQRIAFKALADQLAYLNKTHGLNMDTLSLGMSGDLEASIEEGATIVRIGTALFGTR